MQKHCVGAAVWQRTPAFAQNRKYQLLQTFTMIMVRLAQSNFSTDVKEQII